MYEKIGNYFWDNPIKHVVSKKPEYLRWTYNELASIGEFSNDWKEARLFLLIKEDKPMANPSWYRLICLLDVKGKLFE